MLISVVNRTRTVADKDLQIAIRAVNRQISDDFEPYWSFGGRLRLEGAVGKFARTSSLADMRGDAIIYLIDKTTKDVYGYHEANFQGIPYSFVYTEVSDALDEAWSVTLSHEALELIGDPQVNLLIEGPHPEEPNRDVFHWFEMCDAVQDDKYEIDGVWVSNFVLPLYFTVDEQIGGRNDFLGLLKDGMGLKSFGVRPGGYIGFYDPKKDKHVLWSPKGDKRAAARERIKAANASGRGSRRLLLKTSRDRDSAHADVMKAISKTVKATAMATAGATAPPIEHVVVLMLENRSFDHLLGDLDTTLDVDGIHAPDGSLYSNRSQLLNDAPYTSRVGAKTVLDEDQDPDHEFESTQRAIAGGAMSGFVQSFFTRYPMASRDQAWEVMSCFERGKLPVIHNLAQSFTVCDRWFASVPGPTWPNRLFAMSGTSKGDVSMPQSGDSISTLKYAFRYTQDTVFDRLNDAGKPWKIYHDGLPCALILTGLRTQLSNFRGMEHFESDAAGPEADFPAFTWIEPCYNGADANDQHPPSDVLRGEALVAKVFNAIRSNEQLWLKTLLIIVHDEHGGFYDHVPPMPTIPPDDARRGAFGFDTLGVRVPAILVSPYASRQVSRTVFDHTSILRYVSDKWNLKPLGNRAASANSLAPLLDSTAREDVPLSIDVPHLAKVSRPTMLDGTREALISLIENLYGKSGETLEKRARVTTRMAPASRMSPEGRVKAAVALFELAKAESNASGRKGRAVHPQLPRTTATNAKGKSMVAHPRVDRH